MGLSNVKVMVPFCRTLKEADLVLAEMAENGLERDATGREVYVMSEIPVNMMLAESSPIASTVSPSARTA